MPELPEVEHARRTLARWAEGRRIAEAEVGASRLLRGAAPAAVRAGLVGRRVEAAERRGKWILVRLEGDAGLGLHLGMSGKVVGVPTGGGPPPYARLVLHLDDGGQLAVTSRRLFGRVVAAPFVELAARPELRTLGPDPLEADDLEGLLARALAGTRRPVKTVLMDQTRVAGLGNIQAAEALWRAGIHPAAPASGLGPEDRRRLAAGIAESLARTLADLERDGTYLSEGGSNPFRVYGRAGEGCPRCGAPIVREVLGGRATFRCPTCQDRGAPA